MGYQGPMAATKRRRRIAMATGGRSNNGTSHNSGTGGEQRTLSHQVGVKVLVLLANGALN